MAIMYTIKSTSLQVPLSLLTTLILVDLIVASAVSVATVGTPQSMASIETDPCATSNANFTLTPELWKSAQIDQYIAQNPNVGNQTISQYAASVGLSNFFCGIGLECGAGQICYPAIGKDYLVLYAIQQWNNFMNQLYKVIGTVTIMLSDSSAVLVTEFIPLGIKQDSSVFGWAIATLVFSIIGIFTGPLVPLFLPAAAVTKAATAGVAAGTTAKVTGEATTVQEASRLSQLADNNIIASTMQESTQVVKLDKLPPANLPPQVTDEMRATLTRSNTIARRRFRRDLASAREAKPGGSHLKKRGPPNILAYTSWSFLDIHLTKLRNRLQNFVSVTVKAVLASPIYSDSGLAPIIADGSFLIPNPDFSTMLDETQKLGTIVLLSELFVSLKFVATIGQDPCQYDGPAGAWSGDDVLSHCDEQGVMRSIVMAQGDQLHNKIRNAKLLQEKYKYSVYDLVTRATECQTKYGVYGSDKIPRPTKESSVCAFQLPVCDMTTPAVKQRLSEKNARKKRMAKICREEYKLPI